MRKKAYILAFSLLICSCSENIPVQRTISYTPSTRTIDLGQFKIDVPGKWERFYFQDGDTLSAGITDKDDTLLFTYGNVVYVENEEYVLTSISAYAEVSGFPGKMSIPEKRDDGQLSLVVLNVEKDKNLIIESRGVQNINRMSNILSTLSLAIGNGETFIPSREQIVHDFYTKGDGAKVFIDNCKSCHHPLKRSSGPSLTDIMKYRSAAWLVKFLTDKKFMPNDIISKEMVKDYGFRCIKFPQLKKVEVYQLHRFLVGQEYLNRVIVCP